MTVYTQTKGRREKRSGSKVLDASEEHFSGRHSTGGVDRWVGWWVGGWGGGLFRHKATISLSEAAAGYHSGETAT